MISTFFKGMTPGHISQIFHEGHQALDITGNKTNFGYGTPLCAPENCLVLGITKSELSHDNKDLEAGYGVRLKGLETGLEYLYWHCLPTFPVYGGDSVPRGQIVAYMGNGGPVYQGGKYVPLEERTTAPFKGTHLHVQVEKDGVRIDPLPLINFHWQPTYSFSDYLGAMLKVLNKISKQIT
jgi:hypothetical protein